MKSAALMGWGLALCLAAGGAAPAAQRESRASGNLHLRAFPLQRLENAAVVWLEVAGAEATNVDSGAEQTRLLVGSRSYRPSRALVKRVETDDPNVELDGLNVRRTPGAAYLRFVFPDVPADLRTQPELSWVWHRKETAAPLRWEGVRVGRTPRALGARTGEGFQVRVPEAGWQERGPIRLSQSDLDVTASRTAWFHLEVRPDGGGRFPARFIGYELRFVGENGDPLPLTAATSTGRLGGETDTQEIVGQFQATPGEIGTLEWAPVFTRSTGREFRLEVPLDRDEG